MYRYRSIELPARWAGSARLQPYGLLAEQLVGGRWTVVAVTADLSCSKARVEELAADCTRRQLEPADLMRIIQEALF